MIVRILLCLYSAGLLAYLRLNEAHFFYAATFEVLYNGLLALFALYIGLDFSVIVKKSFDMPKGENSKIPVKKYFYVAICLVSLWIQLYKFAELVNFEKIQVNTSYFLIALLGSVISSRKINKIAESKGSEQ